MAGSTMNCFPLKLISIIWSLSWLLCHTSALKIPTFQDASLWKSRSFRTQSLLLNKTNLEPQNLKQFGSKRVLMRYGPFTVPGIKEEDGMKEFNELDVEKPCEGCVLTGLRAGLEYPNGTIANANTGMWLHHIVMYDFGRKDSVCPEKFPYRFFASGNERTPLDMTVNSTSFTGFPLLANSSMGVTMELMNEAAKARDAVLTVDFEFIPSLTSKLSNLDALWLDVTGACGDSDIAVPPGQSIFSYDEPSQLVNSSGLIVAAGGHLHDGGVSIRIDQNKRPLCEFQPAYGESAGYVSTAGSLTRKHISSMKLCYRSGVYRTGDDFGLVASYNLTKYSAMKAANGTYASLMGIAILYLQNLVSTMDSAATGKLSGGTSLPARGNTSLGSTVPATQLGPSIVVTIQIPPGTVVTQQPTTIITVVISQTINMPAMTATTTSVSVSSTRITLAQQSQPTLPFFEPRITTRATSFSFSASRSATTRSTTSTSTSRRGPPYLGRPPPPLPVLLPPPSSMPPSYAPPAYTPPSDSLPSDSLLSDSPPSDSPPSDSLPSAIPPPASPSSNGPPSVIPPPANLPPASPPSAIQPSGSPSSDNLPLESSSSTLKADVPSAKTPPSSSEASQSSAGESQSFLSLMTSQSSQSSQPLQSSQSLHPLQPL